jgi:hypothetical protein
MSDDDTSRPGKSDLEPAFLFAMYPLHLVMCSHAAKDQLVAHATVEDAIGSTDYTNPHPRASAKPMHVQGGMARICCEVGDFVLDRVLYLCW